VRRLGRCVGGCRCGGIFVAARQALRRAVLARDQRSTPPPLAIASALADTKQREKAVRREKTLSRCRSTLRVELSDSHVPNVVDHALRSVGTPLDAKTREFFEGTFEHDFGSVRVHADERAAESARALSARAFAVGQHIVFDSGLYRPDAAAGRRLLAHELAHIVQQSRGGSAPASPSSVVSLEASAEKAAAAAGTGTSAKVEGATVPGLQMNAEVYIWNPHVDGYGHAAIKLCDGTYISWWPAGAGTKAQQYWTGRPGGSHSYADDIGPGGEGKDPDATYDLGCNCLDEDAIKKWYDDNFLSSPDPKWAVLKNSCSDVAHHALNEGSSVTNPCYLSISHSNVFWTPKDLGAYADCQARWCKSKKSGVVDATGRYLWENVKEVFGGAAINTLKILWWKGEIVTH
jgi:Domain of unknown function (DUF4157)